MKAFDCRSCNLYFPNMEVLSNHMKLIHQETDHMRILRLTKWIENMQRQENVVVFHKSFDCTECGFCFTNENEMKSHNEKHHFNIKDKSKPRQVLGDEKEILLLTGDLTELLDNIPTPDEESMNEAEKDSKANIQKFLNSEFTTPIRPDGDRGVKRELDSSVANDIESREYSKETYPQREESNDEDKCENCRV